MKILGRANCRRGPNEFKKNIKDPNENKTLIEWNIKHVHNIKNASMASMFAGATLNSRQMEKSIIEYSLTYYNEWGENAQNIVRPVLSHPYSATHVIRTKILFD